MRADRTTFSTLSWAQIIKALFVVVPIIAFFCLLNDHLLFSRSVTYIYRPGRVARVISPKEPTSILQTASTALRWKLTKDALPFQVTVPRAIEAVRIRGKLQAGSQPVVWLKAEGANNSDMSTLVFSSTLNELDWKNVSDGTMTLWMRDKREVLDKQTKKSWTKEVQAYNSVAEFLTNPPDLGTVATVGIDRLALANLQGVDLGEDGVMLPQIFRGAHQFYVYTQGNHDLTIAFDKIDRNRKKDDDILTVRLASAKDLNVRQPTWRQTIKVNDDGNLTSTGPQGKPQHVTITVPNAERGAYFVEIETNEDVLVTNLTSSTPMLSFVGRIFIAEGPAYGEKNFQPLTMLTNGSTVTMTAAHEPGKQDVTIGNKKYSLKGVNVEVSVGGLNGVTSFHIARPDIKLSSDGLITIAPAKILPTSGTKQLSLITPNFDALDYVFAAYQLPTSPLITFDERYDWSQLAPQGKRLQFQLEFPGLTTAEATIALKELKATLIRGPFPWGKIVNRLGGLFQ